MSGCQKHEQYNTVNPLFKATYTIRRTAGRMSPGFVAYENIFPMKAGRSCSMVSMMMSYIFSWPLGGKHQSSEVPEAVIFRKRSKAVP